MTKSNETALRLPDIYKIFDSFEMSHYIRKTINLVTKENKILSEILFHRLSQHADRKLNRVNCE